MIQADDAYDVEWPTRSGQSITRQRRSSPRSSDVAIPVDDEMVMLLDAEGRGRQM